MAPAFSSVKQAAVFALLLLVLLLLPALMTKSLLPSREEIYSSIWWANGAFPYIDQQIFKEKGNIDIAIIGPSRIFASLNTLYIQNQLSKQLGHPAVVRTLGWGGAGYDGLYYITKDLLEHRNVHMLIFYDVYNEHNIPNSLAPRWFRWSENADSLKGLPIPYKLSYYYAAIIGMPRNLLGLIRSNLPIDLFSSKRNPLEIQQHTDHFVRGLGSVASRNDFKSDLASDPVIPFEDYKPVTTTRPSDVCIYSSSNKDSFEFIGSAVPSWQLHFARKFADVAAEHGCQLVLIHIPAIDEMRSKVIQEREFWPEALHAKVTMVGIPSAKLFEDLTDEEVFKLFIDRVHMNKNGQEYFTPIITPSLLKAYATSFNY